MRGENVTTGYFNAAEETARAFEDGWFHTGDIGEIGADGQLFIRGRKKEMIVTPEGLNVFPEDVERVLNAAAGRARLGGRRRRRAAARSACTRCWCSSRRRSPTPSAATPTRSWPITRRFAACSSWPEPELPRTEGTRKLKRAAIRDWVKSGGAPRLVAAGQRSAGGAAREARGPSRRLAVDDARRARPQLARTRRADGGARGRVPDAHRRRRVRGRARRRRRLRGAGRAGAARRRRRRAEPVDFPAWNRALAGAGAATASACRPGSCRSRGSSRGSRSKGASTWTRSIGPVIFAANHQSHMDVPVILAALPAAAAVPRRAGDGEGVLQGALLPRRSTRAGPSSPTA